ncbi:MAG: hypothetical protein ACR2RB_16770 [Gammaproteobacteria bacterium]
MSRIEALRCLSPQDNYTLILVKTDINNVAGVKFASELRAQNIDTPITFISDFDDDLSITGQLAPPRCSIGRSPQGGHVLHCCIRRACMDPTTRLAVSEALEGKLPVAFEYYDRTASARSGQVCDDAGTPL